MVTLFLKGEVKIAAFCTKEFDTFLYGKAVDDDDDDDDEATTTRRRRRGDDDEATTTTTTTTTMTITIPIAKP